MTELTEQQKQFARAISGRPEPIDVQIEYYSYDPSVIEEDNVSHS